MQKKINEHI